MVDNIRMRVFGEFRNLRVQGGEPVWDPAPEIMSHVKLGSQDRSLPVHEPDGSTLVEQFTQLFDEFDRRRNFTIKCLQFRKGIPTDMDVKEAPV